MTRKVIGVGLETRMFSDDRFMITRFVNYLIA